ncbi:hypothetical protein prwr041_07340 [Prevotella herbatica]|uniref:Uncharacterized protein n=1 Tax=Prevotella herbatica TaxID=2801997 RepID=A0ABN6EG44_9BACT|nr:hypothetical protein prwr041_07340 [Prevotella herbatica]
MALYYHILDIKALEKHKYTRFRALLATTKFKQKFYRTAIKKLFMLPNIMFVLLSTILQQHKIK